MTVETKEIKTAPGEKESDSGAKKNEVTETSEETGESIAIMKLKTHAYNILAQIDNHNMQINQLRQQLQQVNEQIIRVTQEEART